jgi:dTDP-4-dehydrorhamnose reductase
MIVGHGDIAKVLNDRKEFLFFAAGVSNSSEKDESRYLLERKILGSDISLANELGLSLVYFSSIACYFSTTRYTKHKLEMELLIKAACNNYTIIRIGNIKWGTNPNTFINYIRNKKAKGEPVEIRDEWKYLISKEQLLLLTDNLPLTGKNEISVFGECKKVIDCV